MSCSCKHLDSWDIKCFLSLLEIWATASSLPNFQLASKIVTLLALVKAKCCSDVTLMHIDSQHAFLQCPTNIFVPGSGGNMD